MVVWSRSIFCSVNLLFIGFGLDFLISFFLISFEGVLWSQRVVAVSGGVEGSEDVRVVVFS